MKHRLIVLTLTLVLSLFIVGCQPTPELPDNDVTADPGIGNEKKDDNTSNPKEDDKTNENIDHAPKEEGESEENNTTEPEAPTEPEPEPLPEIGTAVGNRFKDITLQTVSGGTISTADLRGKIVIVNSWATWCPPCREELPDFDRIATKYKDQLVIIAADVDAGNGSAKSYVEQHFPTTDIVFAYDTIYGDAYYAAGGWKYVPRTAIIDQNGVIIYSDDGAMSYSQLVAIIEGALAK